MRSGFDTAQLHFTYFAQNVRYLICSIFCLIYLIILHPIATKSNRCVAVSKAWSRVTLSAYIDKVAKCPHFPHKDFHNIDTKKTTIIYHA